MTEKKDKSVFTELIELSKGKWSGEIRTWINPNSETVSEQFTGNFNEIIPNVLQFRYKSKFQSYNIEAVMLISYKSSGGQISWIDSFHTQNSIQHNEGKLNGNKLQALGHYSAGAELWGWETIIELSDYRPLITMFNIPPKDEKYKGVEFVFLEKIS
jgi:hypothetical protein